MIEEIYKVPEKKDWSLEVARDVNKSFSYLHKEAVPLQYVTSVPTQVPKGVFVSYDDGTSNGLYYQTGKGTVVSLGLPSGVIVAWSGTIATIPSGWVICDGTNSTPDLTDRFILHADADVGGTVTALTTGGVSSVTLTTANIPAHTHTHNGIIEAAGALKDGTSFGANTGGVTSSVGGGESHTNRDKYYALAYIMKT